MPQYLRYRIFTPFYVRLASVDIGSNAIRMQISSVVLFNGAYTLKKLEYIRFPLRLGQDVFSTGRISEPLMGKFIRLMEAFHAFMDLYDVDDYMLCGTSALREAANGKELVEAVREKTGLQIQIIDGNQEADLINQAIYKFLDDKTYIHIDVGGGSTELTLYHNRQKLGSESFKIGSVRNMSNVFKPAIWIQMEDWVKDKVQALGHNIVAVGTGGNINKLFELAGAKSKKARYMSLNELIQIQHEVAQLSLEERINQFMLNPDRADVIVPASEIYLHVMRLAQSKKIMVPDVGLKDGIIDLLFEKNKYRLPFVAHGAY